MDESPLARLPPELRILIYEYALREDHGYVRIIATTAPRPCAALLYIPHKGYRSKGCRHTGNKGSDYEDVCPLLGLASTCKEIRRESRPVYFAINRFHLTFIRHFTHELPRTIIDTIGEDMMEHKRGPMLASRCLFCMDWEKPLLGEAPSTSNFWPTLCEFRRLVRSYVEGRIQSDRQIDFMLIHMSG